MKNLIKNLFLISILFVSCKNEIIEPIKVVSSDIVTVSEAQFDRSKMKIESIEIKDFEQFLSVTGNINVPPNNRAVISTFYGGYVRSCDLQVGSKVQKGQTLMVIENPDFIDIQKDYLEISKQLKYLKSEFERQKTLYEEKISSEKNYFKAESDYLQAFGIFQSLKEKLTTLNINTTLVEQGRITAQVSIKAPISGTVSFADASIGAFKSPTDKILEIINSDALQLQLFVFEKDILNVKIGQKVFFSTSDNDANNFEATISLIGKSINSEDKTVLVLASLNEDLKNYFIAGMYVNAKIVVETKKGFAVPKEAIWVESNQKFLLVQQKTNSDYEFRKIEVELGVQNEQTVEVLLDQNFNKEAKILTKGVFELQP